MSMRSSRRGQAGVSLLEVAVGLAIAGLLLAGVLSSYVSYKRNMPYTNTEFTRNLLLNAMSEFVLMHGRLPCPADPTLPRTSPNAGREFCLADGGGKVCRAYGGGVGGQICRIDAADDTQADADGALDPALVGVVPYVTLGLVAEDAIDGWRNQHSYTVTEYLTRAGSGAVNSKTYSSQFGALKLSLYDKTKDAFDNAQNSETGKANTYPYFIISHGPDGKGAYSLDGHQTVPCTGEGYDIENCNKDAAFYSVENKGALTSFVKGPRYYDDPAPLSQLNKDTDKWGAGSSAGTGFIYNKAGQKVGIGTHEPQWELHVVGDISAESYAVNQVCDSAGANCFIPEIFGGAGISCNGGLVLGISAGKLVCQTRTYGSDYIPGTCAAGKYVVGFGSDRKIICQ